MTAIISGLFSFFGSILGSLFANRAAKKRQFFEAYFKMRAEANEELMESLYQYSISMTINRFEVDDDEFDRISQSVLSALAKAQLYCSDDALKDIKQWYARIQKLTNRDAMPDFSCALTNTLRLLREDMKNCREYKF